MPVGNIVRFNSSENTDIVSLCFSEIKIEKMVKVILSDF